MVEYKATGPVPEIPVEAESAVGNGYGESKWVSERILSVASSETSLRPIVVRVGQVTGGVNGCWNALEWIPSIVHSAALVKCLPSLDQVFGSTQMHASLEYLPISLVNISHSVGFGSSCPCRDAQLSFGNPPLDTSQTRCLECAFQVHLGYTRRRASPLLRLAVAFASIRNT